MPPTPNPPSHPPSNDVVDDIPIIEPMDDVQLFLAELRHSTMTQPALNISNVARYEFISNLLITEKVKTTPSSGYHEGACAICLGEYQPGDIMCSSHNTHCNHKFHQTCIFRWLLQNRDDCPCCRNNYLALSDDDSVATPDPVPSRPETSFDMEDVTSNSPLTTSVAEMAWIPSYLAPFPPSRPSEEPEIDDEEPNTDPSTQSSSSLLVLPTSLPQVQSLEVRDTNNDGSQSEDLDEMDPEVWNCPSVDDSEQEHWSNLYTLRNKSWISNRRSVRRSVASQPRYNSHDEQTQSLQLDDLIVEGLMQRLQARSGVYNIGLSSSSSSSSSSVYTEGSTDVDVNLPKRSIVVDNSAREESEMCAICRADYAVNEELCWSQDPLCTHVFHRSCMQQWIMEGHDFCPFCRAHDSNRNQQLQQPCRTYTTTDDNSETVRLGQDYPLVSSFGEAIRGDKVSSECSQRDVMDSSAGSETSFLDTDLDILVDV